jgi:hypothetical protein
MAEEQEDLEISVEDSEQLEEQYQESESSLTDETVEFTPDEVRSNILQIENLAEMDPSILEDDEYLKMKATLEEMEGGEEEEYEEEHEEEYEEEHEEEEEEEEEDGEDPFGLFKQGDNGEDIELEMNEEMLEYLAERYSINDPSTFLNSVDTWRTQAQDGAEVQKKFSDIEEGLASLPGPIKESINAFANGQDWQGAFSSSGSRLNYGSDFENQEKEAVVQHYFGDKFDKLRSKYDEEEIDTEDYEERYTELHELSERLFNTDRKTFEKNRAEIIKEQEQVEELRSSSVISSVEGLKKEYPNFSNADLQRVKQRMVDGTIEEQFYEKDGTYKPEAAEMLAFALYGKKVMKSLLNAANKDGITEANELIVKKGNKSLKTSGKGRSPANKQNEEAVSHLDAHFNDDPYAASMD